MSIYSKLASLLSAANTKTGESDATLTDAVQTLIDGYGQGGGGAEDFVSVVEGTGTSYSNPDVTKVKERVFYNDNSVVSVDFPNATSVGDSAFSYSKSLKTINMPKVVTIGGMAFGFTKHLIRASFPLASFNSGNEKFRDAYALITCDYGPGVSKLNSMEFSATYCLSELVLRRTDSIVEMSSNSTIDPNHMTLIMQKVGHVYVPNALKTQYQQASNWSTLYGLNNDIFRSLESYTVDGTTTGALDYSKIWTAHTPAFSLSNEEFDGTKVIDTDIQLFDGGDSAFTIVFNISAQKSSTNYPHILSCLNSNNKGFNLFNNMSEGKSSSYNFAPTNDQSGGAGLNHNSSPDYYGYVRSSGLDAAFGCWSADGKGDSFSAQRRTGTILTLPETLLVGGAWVNGVATPQWKGTINMLKVYKECLNPNEIAYLLGLEA